MSRAVGSTGRFGLTQRAETSASTVMLRFNGYAVELVAVLKRRLLQTRKAPGRLGSGAAKKAEAVGMILLHAGGPAA